MHILIPVNTHTHTKQYQGYGGSNYIIDTLKDRLHPVYTNYIVVLSAAKTRAAGKIPIAYTYEYMSIYIVVVSI